MLGNEDAALLNQHLRAFLFHRLVVPRVGEGHFHGRGGADRARAEEEGGVAGLHFRVGVSADIANLRLIRRNRAGFDHFVQLHASRNARQIAAFIDGRESVVVVGQVLGVRLRASRMAELDFRELQRSLNHVGFMTERVRKNDVAACVRQFSSCVVAFLTFGDVGLGFVGDAQLLAGSLRRGDEVQVVGGVFVVQEDEADLQVILRDGRALSQCSSRQAAQAHHQRKQQRCKLFHGQVLLHSMGENGVTIR